jgi:flagellar basal-body rod protein FlgG
MVSGASGPAVTGAPASSGFGTVQQGFTEASNVDSVTEISNLIIAQRAYEMNSKVITTADQMLQSTNQMKS